MKHLLYYNVNSQFVSDQVACGGDGSRVVSVVDGVSWSKDNEVTHYRHANNDSENLTSYTVTVHYVDEGGNSIDSDDLIEVPCYRGKETKYTFFPKSIDFCNTTDGPETILVSGDTECSFTYSIDNEKLLQTPLTFKIKGNGNIVFTATNTGLTPVIEYKKNNDSWLSITANTGNSAPSIQVAAGDTVQFRGNNEAYGNSSYLRACFSGSTASFDVEGNIMSLINSTQYPSSFKSAYTFFYLFAYCTGLTNAGFLILPATTLVDHCYDSMFAGCVNLITAPVLPATTLASYCYNSMFENCTNLTGGVKTIGSSASTASLYACKEMFAGCTNLKTVPDLPAKTLGTYAYYGMFSACTNITEMGSFGATSLATMCCACMFSRCYNLRTVVSELPATTLATSCYDNMFYWCSGLTKAPALPAKQLANYCYEFMFYGCRNLKEITCLATNRSFTDCTKMWVWGVANTGLFTPAGTMVKNGRWTRGDDGIPTRWSIDYSSLYLTFEITSGGYIYWKQGTSYSTDKGSLYYRKNNGSWTSLPASSAGTGAKISVATDDIIEVYGSMSYLTKQAEQQGQQANGSNLCFSACTAGFKLYGNIMSLTTSSSTYFRNKLINHPANTQQFSYSFAPSLFVGCTGLTDALNLKMPENVKNACYYGMFRGCTSLITAPALPATALARDCYDGMFQGCTSLTTAPSLPATTLANNCYYAMFQGCTSLTTAPALPAMTLASYCYEDMFKGCTSLTTAPELPATTLAIRCYRQMFYGCTNLNYIKCLATDVSASQSTYFWVYNVASTGTFVKHPSMTSWTSDNSGIPSNWTVQDAVL